MAVNPEWALRSPGQLQDTDGSNPVTYITSTGAPDGAADPQDSAAKGSVYHRASQTDDNSPLYVKVDESSSDDDWQKILVANCSDSHDINGNWEWQTDTKILFRDTGQYIYSPSANTGAIALGASGDVWQIGDQASTNYIQVNFRGEATLEGTARFEPMGAFTIWDDFLYQTLAETDTPWILNKGSDGSAADPAISAQEYGAIVLTTGAGDGSTAQDASQLACHIPVQADSGGLVFETRLHINTAITNLSVCAGFTDSTALEEPFTNAADVITSTATDGACFLYDTDATTDEWWMVAVDSDADDAGNAATGTAPVADTYQVLRIEVDSDGNTIRYYINGTLEGTLTDAGVTANTNLYATIIAVGDGTASKTVDVDYVYVAHNRAWPS